MSNEHRFPRLKLDGFVEFEVVPAEEATSIREMSPDEPTAIERVLTEGGMIFIPDDDLDDPDLL